MPNNEKMKSIIYELSIKNELLNKNNNDLNTKNLSLIRFIKKKENQINIMKNSLIKNALKNLFLKKYIKENKSLLNAFTNLKYYKKKKFLQPKLYYDHEIFFYILRTNKDNFVEKGVGDYNINLKLYKRRQTCLTLLKRRKYNNHNLNDISNIDKSFYTITNNNNISFIETKKRCFENISVNKDINNFLINSKSKKACNLEIKNSISYNIINNNINKVKNYDFSVFHFKLLCNSKRIIDKNKNKLIVNNNSNFYISSNTNLIDYKSEIEKLKEQEKLYANLVQEKNELENEIIKKNNEINEMKSICENNESQIEKLNKSILQLKNELNKAQSENKNIITKIKNRNDYTNYEHTKLNFSFISDDTKNEKSNIVNIFNNLSTSKTINYNIISTLDYNNNKSNNVNANDNVNVYDNDDLNKKFEIINQENIYFENDNISSKKEILSSFENALHEIENKNNLFKLLIFETKINYYIRIYYKYFFFIKFLHYSYNKKIKYTFDTMRNILISLKLKHLFKYFPSNNISLYFYKYYTKCISISFVQDKKKLLKYIQKNEELEQKVSLFTDTFKQYEESHKNEDEKKNNELSKYKSTINDLNNEIENMKNYKEKWDNYSNESIEQKKIIDGLNEEINDLKKNNIILENKIISQQEVIKSINSKMQQCQEENEQNEQNYNSEIEQVQSKFEEYEKSISDLNNEKILLIKDNDKMKVTIENLNKSNEKLFEIVKNSKSYEIENEKLLNKNNELKIDNEKINNRYKGLKEDFDNLKLLSEESKNELTKAMHEMELYSHLLQTLENKLTIAENDKRNALNERDKAINDVKALRQRYINFMGDGFA